MNLELLQKTNTYKLKLQEFEIKERALDKKWRECLDKKASQKYSARTALKKHTAKKTQLADLDYWSPLELTLLLEDLCEILGDDKIGGKWTQKEREMYDSNRTQSEGRGEKSFRFRLGFDVIPGSSSRDCDTPWAEVKEWIVFNAKSRFFSKLENIRITKKTQSYNAVVFTLGKWIGKGKIILSDEQEKNVERGELSLKSINTMPQQVIELFEEYTKPSKTLLSYPKMACVSPTGFVVFDSTEYDELWALSQITQGGPKYKVIIDFIKNKIKQVVKMIEASSMQHQHSSLSEDPSQTSQRPPSAERDA